MLYFAKVAELLDEVETAKNAGRRKTDVPMVEFLLRAAGCDARATPRAYWDWEERQALFSAGAQELREHAPWPAKQPPPGGWLPIVKRLAEASALEEGVPGELRPWCDPRFIRSCSYPATTLGVVATVIVSGAAERPELVLAGHGVLPSLNDEELVRLLDPSARSAFDNAGDSDALTAQVRQLTFLLHASFLRRLEAASGGKISRVVLQLGEGHATCDALVAHLESQRLEPKLYSTKSQDEEASSGR